ncbi:zinc-binding dehydrogenase [Halocella sp. SP3-1]|nr:zinc-binding dehydrogenase [Halocella sp. SP3-1]
MEGDVIMKAAVLTDWEKIEVKDVAKPEIDDGECLIKVSYAGVCGSDVHIYGGHHPTAQAPVILGHEFVGIVKEIKDSSCDIRVGDRVVVEPLISCGICEACREGNWHVCKELKLLGIHSNGGFAEYVKVSVDKVIKTSKNLTDHAAALTEPFAVGFHVNQRAGMKNGDKVLVIGAGPIGLIVGMVAKISGASEVVFSEINLDRIKQIKSFGFENVINPKEGDEIAKANEITNNQGFDVVYEVSGTEAGLSLAAQACRIRGTIVPVGFPNGIPKFDMLKVIFKELNIVGSRVYSFDHFRKTVDMLEKIIKNELFDLEKLISEIYQIEDLEKAIKVMQKGKNLGKILIEC